MLPHKLILLLLCLLLVPFRIVMATGAVDVEVRVVALHPPGVQGQRRDGVSWHCKGRQCVVKGPLPADRLMACRWIRAKLGPVTGFHMKGHTFTAAEMTRCNGTGLPAKSFHALPNPSHSHIPSHTPEWRNQRPADPGHTLRRQAGEIRFGDGIHGRRPPTRDAGGGLPSYRKGLGQSGLASPNAVHGGKSPESPAAAERRLPATLQHRQRAVTVKDMHPLVPASPGTVITRARVKPADSSNKQDSEEQ